MAVNAQITRFISEADASASRRQNVTKTSPKRHNKIYSSSAGFDVDLELGSSVMLSNGWYVCIHALSLGHELFTFNFVWYDVDMLCERDMCCIVNPVDFHHFKFAFKVCWLIMKSVRCDCYI